jgi:hypothetical protein
MEQLSLNKNMRELQNMDSYGLPRRWRLGEDEAGVG